MYCLIKRNQSGNIVSVTTPEGKKSKLFENINSNPFLGTPELSARIFAAAYNKEVQDNIEDYQTYSNGEPKVVLKSTETGKVFSDIEDAILDSDANVLALGFIKKDLTVDTILTFDTNKTERSRFIKEAISQGIISPTRILNEKGENVFQGEGQFDETRRVTGQLAKDFAKLEYGKALIYDKNTNTFTIPSKQEVEEITYSDGRVETVYTEDIPSVLNDPKLEFKRELIMKYLSKFAVQDAEGVSKIELENNLARLETSLNRFISSLGFSATTLDNYRKDYKTKYGQDPDVQALADLANKVVAFGVGEYTVENLSEEVAHIAIETYEEQDSIESALAVVNLTPEYNEHAEYYRSKYSKELSGIDLETKVRKEVLGKILKNVITNTYLNQNTTEAQKTIIEKLRDIWTRFLNLIRSTATPDHVSVINELNSKIADAIKIQDSKAFSTQNIKEDYFYSAMDSNGKQIEKSLQEARNLIDNLFKSVLKQPTPNQAQLENIVEEMSELDILSSVNTITSIANNQKNVLTEKVKESSKIDPVSLQTYLQLKENLLPTLQAVRFDIKEYKWTSKENKKRAESLMDQIDSLTSDLGNLEAEVVRGVKDFVEDSIQEHLAGTTLSAKEKEQVISSARNGIKDLTYLQRRFGLASNSPNIVVQMLQEMVASIYTNTTQRFRNETTEALDKLYDNDWQKFEKNFIERDSKGNKTGYYRGPFKRAAAEKALKNKKIELLVKYSGKTDKKEVEKLLGSRTEKALLGTEKYYNYKQEVQDYENSVIRETRMNDTYRKERSEKMDSLKLSQYTREYLSTANNTLQQIYSKYRKEDGTVDLTKSTPAEKLIIKNHQSTKKQNKSAFDQFGEYRHGLVQKRFDELTEEDLAQLPFTKEQLSDYRGEFVLMQPGFAKEDLPSDSLLAFELNIWNLNFAVSSQEGKTIKDTFREEVRKIENEGSAYDFTISNGQIVLNDLYYDSLIEGTSYVKAAQDYLNELPDSDIKKQKQKALEQYEKALRIKKDISRQNKRVNQPLEMDVKNMDSKTRAKLLELEEELKIHRDAISLPKGYMPSADSAVETVTVMNEDYEKIKIEKGLSDYEFCLQHMSPSNRRVVEAFRSSSFSILSGYETTLKSTTFENFIQEQFDNNVVNDSMEKEEVLEKLSNEFAKTRVASYFKRVEPKGYSEAIQALKENKLKISDILDQTSALDEYPAARFLEVSPDYSWTEDLMSQRFLNKNYPKDDKGFYKKYKLDWMDNEWFDYFGIDKENFKKNPTEDLNKLVATKNQEEYEAYKTIIGLREKALELLEESEATDKFKMVQISATALEKLYDIKDAKANLKDSVKDFIQNRSDELIYGEDIDSNLKVIPRYFKQDLESPDMLSESIISSELINLRQAILYTERKKSEADMLAFQTHLGKQEFKAHTGIGAKVQKKVKGQVSNYYQFGEEFVNHHLYGVQQNRHFVVNVGGKEIDLVRVVSKLQGWSTLNNLAFNPLAALTSMSTGVLNNVTDRAVGDRYHKSSINRSNSVVTRLMGDHLKNAGKINKKDGLTAAMEINGILEDSERVKNSSLGRLGRIVGSTPFGLDLLANKPVTPKVMMNVYCDTRYYDGKFLSWNEFRVLRTRDGVAFKQLESEWLSMKNESLLDYVDLNTFQPNEKFKSLPNQEQLWKKTMSKVSNKIKRDVQAVDGVLSEADKVAAQRDVLTNFLLQHRGWFLINMARRFKKAHYNAADGKFEEGHYRSLWNFIAENYKEPGKIITEYYKLGKTNLNRQQNIKRVGIEGGITAVLGLLGFVLFGDDEDDEDKSYGEVLAEYWYVKTYSEYNSSQIFGIPGTIEEMVKSPIPSSKFFSNYNPYSLLTSADEFEGTDDEPGINKSIKMLLQTNPMTGLPYKRLKTYGSKESLAASLGYFKKMNAGTLFNLGE